MMKAVWLGLTALALTGGVGAQEPGLSLVQPPALDRSGDGTVWRYELLVRQTLITLTGLVVSDGQGRVLATLDKDQLVKAVTARADGTPVIYLDIPAGDTANLRHEVRALGPDGKELRLADGGVNLSKDQPIMIGPPLAGGPWVAIHSAEWPRGHRRVFYEEGGRQRIPGRFAIDFVKVGEDGAITRGDPDRPGDALGYGDDVLAVADARVVAMRDGMAEMASIDANGKHSKADAAGNHVVLEIAPGRFAFYEHLKPGSVRVKVGDKVRRGQVIGQLGFTGDSTGPHLHFHIADAQTPLGGEGQPFTIDSFRLVGGYGDLSRLGKGRWADTPPVERNGERPGANSVLYFAVAP
ncbi:M23 family metallopeptidase [Niveispirillum sp. KHB5.9]|uniref:M23 family metallopeptidase n=1 Tax=Niveispirillum sp. KHB5.9 TaxID=3400269 RepID=UPI003A891238